MHNTQDQDAPLPTPAHPCYPTLPPTKLSHTILQIVPPVLDTPCSLVLTPTPSPAQPSSQNLKIEVRRPTLVQPLARPPAPLPPPPYSNAALDFNH